MLNKKLLLFLVFFNDNIYSENNNIKSVEIKNNFYKKIYKIFLVIAGVYFIYHIYTYYEYREKESENKLLKERII